MNTPYQFRKATIADCHQLEKLITLSAKAINGQYYEQNILNAAIGSIWTVDQQLILDGTYWLAENQENHIVGCGGWSKRKLLFGNDTTMNGSSKDNQLDPQYDPAKIRAFFVHPDYTRQGIGRHLLNICEHEAQSNGFRSLELVATLSGIKLYSASGFQTKKHIQIDLGNGIYGEAVEMYKRIVEDDS